MANSNKEITFADRYVSLLIIIIKVSKLALEALTLEVEVLESVESKVLIGGNGDKPNSGNLRAVFDKSDGLISFYDDNGTPSDLSDDKFLYSGKAHNNVTSKSDSWPTGTYSIMDQNSGHRHHGTGNDTTNGAYGTSGIYRADPFYDDDAERTREGMGIHSGRANKDFENRKTNGCIRVEQSTMDKIDEYTKGGMKFTELTVRD